MQSFTFDYDSALLGHTFYTESVLHEVVIYCSQLCQYNSPLMQLNTYFTICLYPFCAQVVEKKINQTDAIFEVYTDRIIEEAQTCDQALLWITSHQKISELPVKPLHVCTQYVTKLHI